MANYDNINGVGYRRYEGDDTEPTTEQEGARLDEMYVSGGRLHVSADTIDGHIHFSIPILPVSDWDDVVDSLPVWGGE